MISCIQNVYTRKLHTIYFTELNLKHLITRVGVENTFFVKEGIQPQVPLRLPCYDFTPVMKHTVVNALPKVRLSTSGAIHFHGVTGGVYKTRERIHRDMLIRDY